MTSSGKGSPEQTILIVENDQALLKVLVKSLGHAGFPTEGVVSGSEAIERVMKDPPALLLLDYRLPDMTGEQVIKSLTRLRYRVPFIVTTGHGDENIAVAVHSYPIRITELSVTTALAPPFGDKLTI